VRDTGGTVIFSIERELCGGSKKTVEFALRHNKPCLHLHSRQGGAAQGLRDFVADNKILALNVAGPRASEEPEVGEFVKSRLTEAFPGVG
jgi:Circularly permutated YpsA SLOG family